MLFLMNTDNKICVNCGKTFNRVKMQRSKARFEKMIACSRECLKEYNNVEGVKRLDPATELPFISGISKRTVGGEKQIFHRYNLSRVIKTGELRGYFKEDWKKA